jgi:hypothetical protein
VTCEVPRLEMYLLNPPLFSGTLVIADLLCTAGGRVGCLGTRRTVRRVHTCGLLPVRLSLLAVRDVLPGCCRVLDVEASLVPWVR